MQKTEEPPELKKHRRTIEGIDRGVVKLLAKRREIAIEIGKIKEKNNLPRCDMGLEKTKIRLAVEYAKKITDDPKFHELVELIIKRSIWTCRDCQFDNIYNKRRKKHKSAEV